MNLKNESLSLYLYTGLPNYKKKSSEVAMDCMLLA